MKHIFLALFCSLLYSSAVAQKTGLNYPYVWEQMVPKAMAVDPINATEDVVILKEDFKYFIPSQTTERYLRIKYQTQKGVQEHHVISLPESTDPTYDHNNLYRNESFYHPTGPNNFMLYFAARILRPDGRVVAAQIKDSVEKLTLGIMGNRTVVYAFHYVIKNLQPGDELEVAYKTRNTQYPRNMLYGFGIIDYNTSDRYFFHGPLAKQEYNLSMVYQPDYKYIFFWLNGAGTPDTTINKEEQFITLHWKAKNLRPYKEECGSRPITQLPVVQFYQHDKKWGLKLTNNGSLIGKFEPYDWNYICFYDQNYLPDEMDYLLTKTDVNTFNMNKFYTEIQSRAEDTTAIARFFTLHKIITHEFSFKSDSLFHLGQDNIDLDRMASFVKKRTLIEVKKYEFYRNMLLRIRAPYYLANLADKRFNQIDYDNYFPWRGEMYICMFQGENPYYIKPKNHLFGLNSNELPFYYENTPTMYVPQMMSEKQFDRNTLPALIYGTTPNSGETDNFRTTTSQVMVSLDNAAADFSTKLSLSGQFSTMTRGYYTHRYVDSTVNKRYHHTVFDINPGTKLIQSTMPACTDTFPFLANYRFSYHADNLVQKVSDTLYTISLKNWTKNIIWENFKAEGRLTDFYPDFRFNDRYTYLIELDQPVRLLDKDLKPISIQTDWGSYECSISQESPQSLVLQSSFSIWKDKVPVIQAQEVEEIYEAIKHLEQSSILLSTARP